MDGILPPPDVSRYCNIWKGMFGMNDLSATLNGPSGAVCLLRPWGPLRPGGGEKGASATGYAKIDGRRLMLPIRVAVKQRAYGHCLHWTRGQGPGRVATDSATRRSLCRTEFCYDKARAGLGQWTMHVVQSRAVTAAQRCATHEMAKEWMRRVHDRRLIGPGVEHGSLRQCLRGSERGCDSGLQTLQTGKSFRVRPWWAVCCIGGQ